MCKYSDVFSLAVLIGRGLNHRVCSYARALFGESQDVRLSLQVLVSSLYSVLRVYALNSIVGVDGGEGTPVPIPNTVVKLTCADNTWLATAREDKKTPTLCLLSSAVEHPAVNRRVVGSNPTGGAIIYA